MHERRAASRQPASTEGRSQHGGRDEVEVGNVEGLSTAQARALARSAPLAPAEFKARRRVAEAGISLHTLLHGHGGTREDDPISA